MTTKEADGAKLTTVPSTVATPPGVRVCPGPTRNWVAALGVSVVEPIVNTGGGRDGVTCGSLEVLPSTTMAVADGAREIIVPPPTLTGAPPACKV